MDNNEAAAALVADWPPLTQAQRDRLRMVFASRRTTEQRPALRAPAPSPELAAKLRQLLPPVKSK